MPEKQVMNLWLQGGEASNPLGENLTQNKNV